MKSINMTKAITDKVLHQLAIEVPKAVEGALRVVQMETRKVPVKTAPTVGPINEGKCRAIWNELDKLVAAGKEPDIATVRKLAARKHWNDNTSRIQFYRWKQAHSA